MIPPTTTHRRAPSAHTLKYTHGGTTIDGAQLTLTKCVLSALIIDVAFYHMDLIFAETSDDHP